MEFCKCTPQNTYPVCARHCQYIVESRVLIPPLYGGEGSKELGNQSCRCLKLLQANQIAVLHDLVV